MKKLYLMLALPLNIMAMEVQCPWLSGWIDQETFKSAWADQGKRRTLQMEFELHAQALFATRIQKILEEHGECTCFNQGYYCNRFRMCNDQLVRSTEYEILTLRSLLGERQPTEQGALIYNVVRKVSVALAKKMFGSKDTGEHLLNAPVPCLEADEEQVLEEKIFPELGQKDIDCIKDLIVTGLLEKQDCASDDN